MYSINNTNKLIISAGLCLLALIFCACPPASADDIEAVLDSADGTSGLSVQDSGAAEIMRVDSDGNTTISGSLEVQGSSVFLPGPNAAPVDGAFDNSQWTIWLDEGSNEFELKAKKSDGTVISQTVVASAGASDLDGLSDVNSSTATAGRLLLADGTDFESVQLQGDCTINGAGFISCSAGGAVGDLVDLSDVNSATVTAGRLLVADGTEFESMALQGDASMNGAGFITIADDAITASKIAANAVGSSEIATGAVGVSELADINSATKTAGRLLIADGTDFESMLLQGDCSLNGAGYIDCSAGAGATQLDALSDVNSSTITAGRLLIADGTGFESMQLQGDCTLNGAGFITCSSGGAVGDLVDLSDVNSATVTAGRMLIADGTEFESMALQGDATLDGAGFLSLTVASVDSAEIAANAVGSSEIAAGAVGVSELADINSATATAGRLLLADGTDFESVQLQGDCTINGAGFISCSAGGAVGDLVDLSDVNSATLTAGRLLIADGTDFESMQLQGDATLNGAGFITIGDDAITSVKIATDAVGSDAIAANAVDSSEITANAVGVSELADINSATKTAGRLLIADGTDFESMQLQGDCSINGAGYITCVSDGGATQLDELSDINSSTITAGRLLIADGTAFESMQLQGDATMDGAGFITIEDDAITAAKIATNAVDGAAIAANAVDSSEIAANAVGVSELADINSATKTAGRLLIADGTDFESMQLQGDCSLNGAGYITCVSDGGATQLDELNDINSATITAGRLLIADGTEFESMQLQGDATMNGAGFITIADDAITSAKIATNAVDGAAIAANAVDSSEIAANAVGVSELADINSATKTAGRLLIADGTDFESMQLQGDCSINGAGYITCVSDGGATQLDELNDINSATITAGRLLIADGTEFESMQLQGDATMNGAGFITIADDAITAAKIATAAVGSDAIGAGAVGVSEMADINSATKTAGRLLIADGTEFESMQLQGDCTINGAGYIDCSASSGATRLDALSDVNSATITAGRLLIADGTDFESMQLQGDCSLNGAGYITCVSDGGATQLDELNDVNSATITAGRLLIADGTEFESMQLQGDATMNGAGFITIADDTITSAKIATNAVDGAAIAANAVDSSEIAANAVGVSELADINSATKTAGRLLIADGTEFESMQLQGDCSLNGAGYITCVSDGGATQLDELNDVNSATITAGRLLIADGTEFESMQLQGDATMDGAGFITIADDAITAAKVETDAVGSDAIAANAVGVSELANINSLTVTAGRLLVSDGTDFESMLLQGDCTINGAGFIDCSASAGATQLDELSDVNSATITAGRLLIADGTEFESMQLQGDATMNGAGFITIADDAITGAKIATDAVDVDQLANINSLTVTAGRLLVSDGTDFESMLLDGDCSINGAGFIDCSASAGATQLDALSDVNSATITEGRLLIADGTEFESMQLQGDCSVNGAGFVDCSQISYISGDLGIGTTDPSDTLHLHDASGVSALTLSSEVTVSDVDTWSHFAGGQAGGSLRFYRSRGTRTIPDVVQTHDQIVRMRGFAYDGASYSESARITMHVDAGPSVGSVPSRIEFELRKGDGSMAEIMRLTSDGFVGIGTTDPASLLDINGTITATGWSGIGLDDLSDINGTTATAGRLLIADGTDFESMALSGDATLSGAGALSLAANSVDVNELTLVNSLTITAGRLLIADGTEFESMQLQGDCSMNGAGYITCLAGGATQLDALDDVNSATITAGRLLIADGTEFESMQLQGDATMNGAGFIMIADDAVTGAKIATDAVDVDELANINSLTITAGRLLIADGTDFESMELQGDCSLNGAGYITCVSDGGATQLDELNDVNSATITAGRLLIADGTEFESMQLQGDCTINGAGFLVCDRLSDPDGTDWLFVNEDGHIGIGVSDPAQPLYIATTGVRHGIMLENTGTGGRQYAITTSNNGSGGGGGKFAIYDDTANAYRFTIDSSGQIGIGNNSPASTLDVNGTITATGWSGIGLADLSDVNGSTATAGRLLIADGTDFETMALSGDATLSGAGALSLAANSVDVNELTLVNSLTVTAGRLLIADGTEFESMELQGDCSMNGAGYITCSAGGATQLDELNDVNSATITAGRLLIADGTEFESMQLQGDCTMNGAGFVDCSQITYLAGAVGIGTTAPTQELHVNGDIEISGTIMDSDGALSLDGDEVSLRSFGGEMARFRNTGITLNMTLANDFGIGANTVTRTGWGQTIEVTSNTGSITNFKSQYDDSFDNSGGQVTGFHVDTSNATGGTNYAAIFEGGNVGIGTDTPATALDVNGTITATGWSGIGLEDLSDVNGSTATAGRLLIADGTDFETMALSGDATLSGAGALSLAANSVDVNELTLVNSLTVTAGRLLIADGTEFESMELQGDCSMNGAGYITCSAGGATQLDALGDVNSATITAGRLLIADGTEFESMQLQGDCTMNGAGYITCSSPFPLDVDSDTLLMQDVDGGNIPVMTHDAANSNLFIGQTSGGSVTPGVPGGGNGIRNTFFGVDAGASTSSGYENLFAGHRAGTANTEGYQNVFLGKNAGDSVTTGFRNVYIGLGAGMDSTTTENSVFIGYLTGGNVTTGNHNTMVGHHSGELTTTGSSNVFLGKDAGENNVSGNNNILIGDGVLNLTDSTDNYLNIGNTILGDMATNPATPGSGDASITIDGDLTVSGTLFGVDLDDLSDINGTTATAGRLLIADGTDFESMALSGDVSLDGAGVATVTGIQSGAAPTVSAAGDIGVDTSADQLVYYGASTRVIPYTFEKCFTMEAPTDSDDNVPFFFPANAITVTDVYCEVDGSSTPAIDLTISDGTNAFEPITCDDNGAGDDGSITNASFTSRERMEFDLANSTGTITWLVGCITYTVDQQ